jgi:hypothetical protein
MSHKLSWAVAVLASACSGMAAPAHADTFTWTYNGSACSQLDGLCVVSGIADTGSGTLVTATGGLITSFTGSWDGSAITTLLAPGSFPNDPTANDNVLLYPSTPLLDLFGVSFAANQHSINLFFNATSDSFPLQQYVAITLVPPTTLASFGSFSVVPTAVPGPIAGAGLPGLIMACGGLLGWWRRRQLESTQQSVRADFREARAASLLLDDAERK